MLMLLMLEDHGSTCIRAICCFHLKWLMLVTLFMAWWLETNNYSQSFPLSPQLSHFADLLVINRKIYHCYTCRSAWSKVLIFEICKDATTNLHLAHRFAGRFAPWIKHKPKRFADLHFMAIRHLSKHQNVCDPEGWWKETHFLCTFRCLQ